MSITVKTNFTAGQISKDLFGRGDLSCFENGARALENVIIHPTGGVSRRPGTRYIDEISSKARLLSFEFNTEQTYLICLLDGKMKVYKDGECIAELDSPWTEKQIFEINFTQSADTLLIVHPDVEPQQINRFGDETWTIEPWKFYEEGGFVFCPYFNFYKNKENLTITGHALGVLLTSQNEIFSNGYVDVKLKIGDSCLEIAEFIDSQNVIAKILKNAGIPATTSDWEEQSFSKVRGYPTSITFHQDRMVIGGSRNLPNRLWLSKSSDLFNFDLGKGLDDDAIEFAILSDQVNAIRSVVSGRHLLVFTTGTEWMVTGEPLAPASIMLKRQTSVGSYSKFAIPPQQIDGATIFVSKNGKQLREFLYADVEQAYLANDLTLMANDMIVSPIDAAFSQDENVLYLVSEDGTISCLTSYRSESVTAWSKLKTKGKFISVCVVDDEIYFSTERMGRFFLECLDKEFYVDCGVKLESEEAKSLWSGLDYLESEEICVTADEFDGGSHKVSNGEITLFDKAKRIIAGHPYTHFIEPLPYIVGADAAYSPSAYRVVSNTFRIIDSKSFIVDIGNGYCSVPLRRMSDNTILDAVPINYSGDIKLNSLGWIRDINKAIWSIKSEEALPFTLLSVASKIQANA